MLVCVHETSVLKTVSAVLLLQILVGMAHCVLTQWTASRVHVRVALQVITVNMTLTSACQAHVSTVLPVMIMSTRIPVNVHLALVASPVTSTTMIALLGTFTYGNLLQMLMKI